ncbi:TMF-regulated nuclear protein 1-like [Panicum virgatum]|uniref:TMF-regulated nuclear protein 1-like n=1 Tax=Panicum virgatum TaxID=38727 RepID=UPI0019D6557E|nr:TMF-regulated nuclear protein 1-like [Panicum virgatum]
MSPLEQRKLEEEEEVKGDDEEEQRKEALPWNSIPNFQPNPPPRPARGPPHPHTLPPRPSPPRGTASRRQEGAARGRTELPSRDGVAPPGGQDKEAVEGAWRGGGREEAGGGRRSGAARTAGAVRGHGEKGEEAMACRRLPVAACCSPARAGRRLPARLRLAMPAAARLRLSMVAAHLRLAMVARSGCASRRAPRAYLGRRKRAGS